MPEENLWLKDDEIIFANDKKIITRWQSIKPRTDFCRGLSCYYLDKGYKVSKFIDKHDKTLYYYCDIFKLVKNEDEYIFCDLLIDVLVDAADAGTHKVLDLKELTMAYEKSLITANDVMLALSILDSLLNVIYTGDFNALQAELDAHG